MSVIGTPAYMAPEQAAGRAREVGPAADVWALGGILYACLTGKPPFGGSTRQETLRLVQTAEPVSPGTLRSDVPEALEAIVLKCLRKEPEQRYASAADLAEDLHCWLEGRQPRAFTAVAVRRRLGRHRGLVLCALVALAALLASLPFKWTPTASGPPETSGPQVLIGALGLRKWSRFRLGGKQARLVANKEGFCTLHSTEDCFLDLSRRLNMDRYRIHLEIRHETSVRFGGVGMYFGASETPSANGTVHRLFRIHYNDLIDDTEGLPAFIPRKGHGFPNRFRGMLYFGADLPGRELRLPATTFFQPELVTPSGNNQRLGKWRTLDVEVSPPYVKITWENTIVVSQLDVGQIENGVRDSLTSLKKKHPAVPAIQSLSAGFDLRGAVGLYLYRGSASFRRVRFEPPVQEGGAK
jgi:serine/threonine-protein kinase